MPTNDYKIVIIPGKSDGINTDNDLHLANLMAGDLRIGLLARRYNDFVMKVVPNEDGETA